MQLSGKSTCLACASNWTRCPEPGAAGRRLQKDSVNEHSIVPVKLVGRAGEEHRNLGSKRLRTVTLHITVLGLKFNHPKIKESSPEDL